MDKDSLRQGLWTIIDTLNFKVQTAEGLFINGKKIGKWTYLIKELPDTNIKDCQQLSIYLDKSEFYENDGSVLIEDFEYLRLLSSLKFSNDTSRIYGKIFSGDKYAICECNIKMPQPNCTLRTITGQTIENFNYRDFNFYCYRVYLGIYDRQLTSK